MDHVGNKNVLRQSGNLQQRFGKNIGFGINSTDAFLALCNLFVLVLLKSGWFQGSFSLTGTLLPPAAVNGSIHPFIHATFAVCAHCVRVAPRGPACLSLAKYRVEELKPATRPGKSPDECASPLRKLEPLPRSGTPALTPPVFCPGGASKDSDLQDLNLQGISAGPDQASLHRK